MAKAAPTTVPQTPLPNVTYAQGAIAIMAGGNTIGGLGVSGAPGGQFDEECARTAPGKIPGRMKNRAVAWMRPPWARPRWGVCLPQIGGGKGGPGGDPAVFLAPPRARARPLVCRA